MAERFVYPPTAGHAARVSVANGASLAIFTDAALGGHDWAGAQLWITPDDAAPYKAGTIAEVDPEGDYENLELPLFRPWNGTAIVSKKFELIDGLGVAIGASQAAILARYLRVFANNAGGVSDLADDVDMTLVPNNHLFIDSVTRAIYRWRNGVLELVQVVGTAFVPKGTYSGATTYAQNDLVMNAAGTGSFVSNHAANLNNTPPAIGSSDSHWTYLPLPQGPAGAPGSAIVAATSTSSLAIGTGDKVFTLVEAGARGWAVGATRLRIASLAAPTGDWMEGIVTAYAHPSLTVNIDATAGAGSHADWSMSLIGRKGDNGSDTLARAVATQLAGGI